MTNRNITAHEQEAALDLARTILSNGYGTPEELVARLAELWRVQVQEETGESPSSSDDLLTYEEKLTPVAQLRHS